MAFKEIKAMEELSPNLIPMIDIMFLLLLFFMLNADMSSRELEDLYPPIARHAIPEKDVAPEPDRITVNVHHSIPKGEECLGYKSGEVCRTEGHWRITMSGRPYSMDQAGMDALTKVLTELGKTKVDKSDPRQISDRRIIVRADRTAPYGFVQKVFERAARARLWKLEAGASVPKEDVK